MSGKLHWFVHPFLGEKEGTRHGIWEENRVGRERECAPAIERTCPSEESKRGQLGMHVWPAAQVGTRDRLAIGSRVSRSPIKWQGFARALCRPRAAQDAAPVRGHGMMDASGILDLNLLCIVLFAISYRAVRRGICVRVAGWVPGGRPVPAELFRQVVYRRDLFFFSISFYQPHRNRI